MNKRIITVAFMTATITLVGLLVTGCKRLREQGGQGVSLNDEARVPRANLDRPVNVSQGTFTRQSSWQGMEGKLIDLRGKPVAGGEVVASRGQGAQLRTRTDEGGKFAFIDIGEGTFAVFFKEENGPISPDGRFFTGGILPPQDILATVQVFEGQITSGVVIHTGPKWPKLSGRVLDTETDQPIVNSRITLRRVDNPDYWLEFGPREDGKFTVAVPTVPITIEVSSAGYENWTYRKNALGSLAEPLKITLEKRKL